jgi:hypothetical protein
MKWYKGPQPGDDKLFGGGSFNKDSIGHEAYNFKTVQGKLWGYFQPYLSKSTKPTQLNLARIDPGTKETDELLRHVLVIFIAKRPTGGQVIVGWYKDATVYRDFYIANKEMNRDKFDYNIETRSSNAVLLPEPLRTHSIPTGKGKTGQANACYLYESDGMRKRGAWINRALDYVQNYSGANLLNYGDDILSDELSSYADILQDKTVSKGSQGLLMTPQLRRQLEDHAVKQAVRHFTSEKYRVVLKGKPYDLLCTKGTSELRVEVKATQTTGQSIWLTPNEVCSAKQHNSALFIVHSIKVSGKRAPYKLSQGKTRLLNPWLIDKHGSRKDVLIQYDLANM